MAVIWDVVTTESDVATGTCNVLHWTAIDGEVVNGVTHTGRIYGVENVSGNPDSEGFIAYSDVTKDIAISWVKDSLGASKVTEVEAQVASQIDESKNPTVSYVNPWEMGDDF
jgi:hypothetical protein